MFNLATIRHGVQRRLMMMMDCFCGMVTAQKMKFSIKETADWSHLLKKSLMENFIFCAVG